MAIDRVFEEVVNKRPEVWAIGYIAIIGVSIFLMWYFRRKGL